MKDASKKILEGLSERGYRVTAARTRIIEAMDSGAQPQSIRDIAGGVRADEASVYRTIHILLAEGLVEAIPLLDESFVYALKTDHHHHIVCRSCKRIAHVSCSGSVPNKVRHPLFVDISEHEVTHYGQCVSCAD